MRTIFEELVVNTAFIVIPVFFYQMLYLDMKKPLSKSNHYFMILVSGLSIFLCMIDPVNLPGGAILDLRYVPLISSMLYGRYQTSMPLALIIMVYSLISDIQSIWVVLLTVISIISLIPFFRAKYHRAALQKKMGFAALLSIVFSLFVILGFVLNHHFKESHILYLLLYLIIQAFTIWLITYIYETIGKQHVITEELIRSENSKVVSELASSTSHDIRNPLTVAKGLLQLMAMEDYPLEKRRTFIQLSIDELTHAETIINDYLSLAKPYQTNTDTINVSSVVKKAINVIQPYATIHNVEVNTKVQDSAFIKGNQSGLYRALINIAKNAIEAMPTGGILDITLSLNLDKITLVLSDTGIGMTPDEISRLGKPYYTTKEKGTGLGMLVVFNFIKTMHGRLDIQSTPGEGSRFTIEFPRLNHS